MKTLLKRMFASAGYRMERIPRDVPSGRDLAHDLAIVFQGRRGAVCVDVGAHDGKFTELLLTTLDAPVVHAFEPAPEPFARLHRRYATTPGVKPVNAGLSDQSGRLAFNVYDNQALNSFLPLTQKKDHAFGNPALLRRSEVNVLRLDDYAAEMKLAEIDLLKIDTQGFELHVLRGASHLLAAGRVRAVLVELSFTPLYAGQVWAHELMACLFGHNLHLVDFYEKCRLAPFLGWCTALFVRRDPEPRA